MIVEMRRGASQEQVDAVIERAHKFGFDVQLNVGTDKVVVAILGSDTGRVSTDAFEVLEGVESVTRIMRPYKLAARDFKNEPTLVRVGDVVVGGPRVVVMAGPCSIESRSQLLSTAEYVTKAGATVLRGGAFKPRTSPFSFQGLRDQGMELLKQVRSEIGVPVVTEITDVDTVEQVLDYVDILQVGARNMQNYTLLHAVGQTGKPVMLKRGLAATVTEWLQAADHLMASGGSQVILCERGIRTFETATRFTLDIASIGVIKRNSHLPVIVDPSHAAGHHDLVPTLARAAIAAGADGLLIEVHPDPANALSDGLQSLTFSDFSRLMGRTARHCGRRGTLDLDHDPLRRASPLSIRGQPPNLAPAPVPHASAPLVRQASSPVIGGRALDLGRLAHAVRQEERRSERRPQGDEPGDGKGGGQTHVIGKDAAYRRPRHHADGIDGLEKAHRRAALALGHGEQGAAHQDGADQPRPDAMQRAQHEQHPQGLRDRRRERRHGDQPQPRDHGPAHAQARADVPRPQGYERAAPLP